MPTKEEIYDTQIAPLMAEIIDICKTHKIANICTFSLDRDEGLCCTTSMLEDDSEPPAKFLEAISVIFPPSRNPMMIAVEKPDGSKEIHAVL